MGKDLERVLVTEEEIHARLAELAQEVWDHYAGEEFLLVGVLKGAVLVMADLMRAHLSSGGVIVAATHLPLGIAARELRIGERVS